MELTEKLSKLTDAYCEARGVSVATVSGIIFKNSRTLPRVKSGGDLKTRSYHRAVSWISNNWPSDKEWPSDIERPVVDGGRV
ncbi:hypothetical protein AA18890_2347 [Komagataeibacter europaeus LMG 18890]|nr:hypothetical protein AA18890_2347 [Komagataeibacter europaeus LMG 18890]